MVESLLLSSLDDGPAKQALASASRALMGSGVSYTAETARFENTNPAGFGNYQMALGGDFAPKGVDVSAGSERASFLYGGGTQITHSGNLTDLTATLSDATQANAGLTGFVSTSASTDRAMS